MLTKPDPASPLIPVPEDIPGVLGVRAATAPLVPLVFDSPHSGLALPPEFEPAVDEATVRVSSDTHVDDLFSSVPEVGAPLLYACFPRSFLDPNRSLSDMDPQIVDEPWLHPVRDSTTARRGMGLIWRKAWGDTPMYDRPLTVAEAEARIRTYYVPYHAALRYLLDTSFAQFRRVYHMNCHSMTDRGHAMSSDVEGSARVDICIGDLHGTTAGPEFTRLIVETLEAEGLSVAMNAPFKGAELTEAYANPAIGRHSVQFEINRRLYMNEMTRERSADYLAFKAIMTRLAGTLSDFAASQPG